MVFFLLNVFLAIFFILETVYVDRVENKFEDGTNPATSNILILAINTALYAIFYSMRETLTPGLFTLSMRICLLLEGCMLVNLVFCFMYYGWKYSSGISFLVKMFLYIVVTYFIFFKTTEVTISEKTGLVVGSNNIFPKKYHQFFPWTWYDLYTVIFMFILPTFGCVAMLIRNENTGNKLDRHKGYVYTVALIFTWLCYFGINFLAKSYPGYSILHFYMYIPLMVILAYGSWIKSAPSGRGLISFFLKTFFYYVLPAALLGVAFYLICEFYDSYGIMLAVIGGILVIAAGIGVTLIYKPIKKITSGHNSDYVITFEKELASIDYSGEMDEIAENMFGIFKKNVEASSMAVYINGGNGTFENAYISSGKKVKIDKFEMMFESLLNIGRNVVIYSELESDHTLSTFKTELTDFFNRTTSDALIILNEGRDVHGVILLGMKAGNDHYKEYDLNAFKKLYSYFFVFGYYMRNISNKEVIGTVNRELKMSTQIITSIQENYDPVKHPKMDAGAVMIPAHNIGGEFIDMIRLTDNRHMFVLGDLSGKGIAASMNMVILKAIIRSYLRETHDFKQLVVKANQFIRDCLPKGTIFFGMFAIVDFATDTFYYINCGVPAILLYTEAYNNVIEIQGSGHILGFVSDISPYISVKQVKLHKNDIILACTDGLIESHSLRGEMFGKDRIQRNMVANAMYPAQRMAHFEHDELMRFMSHEMEDDVSVLVLKYLSSNEEEADEQKEEIQDSEQEELAENPFEAASHEEEQSTEINDEQVPPPASDDLDMPSFEMPSEEDLKNAMSEEELSSDVSENSTISEDSIIEEPVETQTEENPVEKSLENEDDFPIPDMSDIPNLDDDDFFNPMN